MRTKDELCVLRLRLTLQLGYVSFSHTLLVVPASTFGCTFVYIFPFQLRLHHVKMKVSHDFLYMIKIVIYRVNAQNLLSFYILHIYL